MKLNTVLSSLPKHPLSLFNNWFKSCLADYGKLQQELRQKNLDETMLQNVLRFELVWSMNLATSTHDGQVANRMVLFKGLTKGRDFQEGELDDGDNLSGLTFFTHWDRSRKAQHLQDNAICALCFYWPFVGLGGRQIRVEGRAHKLSDEESDKYWVSRSEDSRRGAMVSKQSEEMSIDRDEFLQQTRAVMDVSKRPDHWGGFSVVPHRIEFWENGANRLHDRVVYEKDDQGEWKKSKIYP